MRHLVLFLGFVLSACSARQNAPAATSPRVPVEAAAAIRAARDTWNQAFAARDTTILAAQWAPNGTLSTGLYTKQGRNAILREHYIPLFQDRPDVTFTRTPREIDGHAAWPIVYELGDWLETWAEPDGRTELRGTYYTLWVGTGDRWFKLSEIYVPTACSGSRYCEPRPR